MAHTNMLTTTPAGTDGLNSAPVPMEVLCVVGGSHGHRGSLRWQRPLGGPCQRARAADPLSQQSVHHTHFSLRREASCKEAKHIEMDLKPPRCLGHDAFMILIILIF